MLFFFSLLFFCARVKVLNCAVPKAKPQATFAIKTLCKAWVVAISLMGGVSSGIEEGASALFLHGGCKGTCKWRRRTSLQDTQEELPSQRKDEERFVCVCVCLFSSLLPPTPPVWGSVYLALGFFVVFVYLFFPRAEGWTAWQVGFSPTFQTHTHKKEGVQMNLHLCQGIENFLNNFGH